MKKYIKVMRLDHWIKQFFIVPGCVCAIFLTNFTMDFKFALNFILGFLATSLLQHRPPRPQHSTFNIPHSTYTIKRSVTIKHSTSHLPLSSR